MKKFASAVLATMLALSASTSAFAVTNWDATDVTGDSSVKDPVISYILPTTLNFSIDAFGKGDATGSQVYSPAFEVVNKSDVAIIVKVKADVTAATGVTLKSTPADVKVDDSSITTKDLYMELIGQEVTAADATATPVATATPIVYEATGAKTAAKAVLPLTAGASEPKPELMTIALAAATYHDDDSDPGTVDVFKELSGPTGAASLRFAGTVNPNAAWVASDVTVKAVFDVRGLTSSLYTAMTGAADLNAEMKAANVMKVGASAPVVNTPSITTAGPIAPTAGTFFEVNFGVAPTAATSITSIKAGTTILVKTTHWTISGTKVSFTASGITAAKGKEMTVTFNDTAKTTATISMSAS